MISTNIRISRNNLTTTKIRQKPRHDQDMANTPPRSRFRKNLTAIKSWQECCQRQDIAKKTQRSRCRKNPTMTKALQESHDQNLAMISPRSRTRYPSPRRNYRKNPTSSTYSEVAHHGLRNLTTMEVSQKYRHSPKNLTTTKISPGYHHDEDIARI